MTTTNETMNRPTLGKHESRAARNLTRFWRRCAAWDMAARRDENVTEEAYERAYSLLNRCTRWAIAQMRFDETETAQNYDKPWRIREGEKLEARRVKLNEALKAYGCTIQCAGYFCENVYPYDFENHVVTGNGLLHFFD